MSNRHTYKTHLIWDGNLGDGTSTYAGYGRGHRILIDGKPELRGSADPMFRGEADTHNPEDLFLAAVSSCHMLSYLALCARNSINVLDYRDDATGELVFDARGGGKFETVTLRPIVTIANAADNDRAMELHDKAHELCYIAGSCSVPIHHQAEIRT
ncbi:MAG: OsmC family protein [Thermoanaerobaculia bacterium]